MRTAHVIINTALNIFWHFKPAARCVAAGNDLTLSSGHSTEEVLALRSLLKRFPFWIEGRYHLAEACLAANDIATAYCEAQALERLSPKKLRDRGRARFVLGRCYLRRGESGAALTLLNESAQLLPLNYSVQEEIAAALTLQGDKTNALRILKEIPDEKITAEGKAALQWLSSTSGTSVQ